MAAAVFAGEEPESLRRFPETGREELSRFLTVPPADSAFTDPSRGRGSADCRGPTRLRQCTTEEEINVP